VSMMMTNKLALVVGTSSVDLLVSAHVTSHIYVAV
jgi:hypothetical protein